MTLSRIRKLEILGFEWARYDTVWEDRLSELADYHKIHRPCNVPQRCSENSKLGTWVSNQRTQYRLHLEGKKSHMTLSRIQELEDIGFEWGRHHVAPWEDRLSELVEYRKIHFHCNVPKGYSENTKLATWVKTQRRQYRFQQEGKTSNMTLPRIHKLESFGFEWKPSNSGNTKKVNLDADAPRARERAVEVPEHVQTTVQTQEDISARDIGSNQVDVAFEPEESDWNGEFHLAFILGQTEEI